MNNLLFPRLSPQHQTLLAKLERQRKMVRRKWLFWVLLFPVSALVSWPLCLLFSLFNTGEEEYGVAGGMIGFLFFIGGTIWISLRFPDPDDLNDEYRKNILPLLVKDTLPGWMSQADHHLSIADIAGTGLYRDRANQLLKEDYFEGPAGNAKAKIYELTLRIKTRRRVWSGRGTTIAEDIATGFYGYFHFISPLPAFSSRCWIFPNEKKGMWTDDWIDISKQQDARDFYAVKTGDPAFDRFFVVFCEDMAATRAHLNEKTRRKLLDAAALMPGACAFSYTGTRLYAMTSFPEDPLTIFKGLSITDELENDHRAELEKMKRFVEILV